MPDGSNSEASTTKTGRTGTSTGSVTTGSLSTPFDCDTPTNFAANATCEYDGYSVSDGLMYACVGNPASEPCPTADSTWVTDAFEKCFHCWVHAEEFCGPHPARPDECCYWACGTLNCPTG